MQLITDLFFLPPDCLRIHKLGTGLCGASIRAVFLSQKMEVLLSVSAVFFAIKTAEDVRWYFQRYCWQRLGGQAEEDDRGGVTEE